MNTMIEYRDTYQIQYTINRGTQDIDLEVYVTATIVPGKLGSTDDSYPEERESEVMSAIGIKDDKDYLSDLADQEISEIKTIAIERLRKDNGI